jgi:hypothetical protein
MRELSFKSPQRHIPASDRMSETSPSSPRATPTFRSAIKSCLAGLLPKGVILKRLFPLLFVILVVTTLVAGIIFPTAYDWRYMPISALGDPGDNPDGFWLMSINGVVLCVMFIPVIGFIHHHLKVICRGMAGVGTFFAIVGVAGLTLTSVLVGSTILGSRTHENLALAAFLGFLFALFFWGFPLVKDRMSRYGGRRQFNARLMALATVLMWGIVAGMASGLGLKEVFFGDIGSGGLEWIDPSNPGYLGPASIWVSFPFWEWLLFWSMISSFVMVVAMAPSVVEPLAPRAK